MKAMETRYYARGKTPNGQRYKLVRGAVKRVAEARGEDYFTSRFEAIYAAMSGLRSWAMRPIGIVFDVHHEDKEVD